MLFYSHRAQYTKQQLYFLKYNSWQVLNSYMFRQPCAILREF